MEKRFGRAALALMLVLCALLPETYADPAACRRPSAGESILGPLATCFPSDPTVAGTGFEGVFEGGEIALQRAIRIVYKNREQHIALLFHASWCPFSKICRPNFNTMASLFPTIPHFAFEESMIRPSILARHGVHGFPTLFLLNSSMRVRYRGPRSISCLTDFYSDVTGVKPPGTDPSTSSKTITLLSLDGRHPGR
ncbi:5'-adenylylsulfate reductase-like 3 [Platanthera guangdongensis]|uniref:5'-adenylylsulfate reductase-like 3 n=1 Tax=Platanthera guangdongensis TaxID=2320717 RepID=A0ABR2LIM2_9ASPA